MGAPRFDDDVAFSGADFAAAIVICRTQYGNLHLGVLHKAAGAQPAALHLGWEDSLYDVWPWRRLWAAPEADEDQLRAAAAWCRLVWDEFQVTKKFPYGLNYSPETSFDDEGRLVLGPGTRGLTCSTFALAIFDAAGVQLVDMTEWPIRQDEDWDFIRSIEGAFCDSRLLRLLEQEVATGVLRVQPQEVVGSCTLEPPVPFEQCREAGRRVLEQLAAG